ncbi:hypothetical protein ACTNDF_04525 [Segatella copri]|uniref:hypothetical protein n=1 Tax=Segatella copri TaxID=165179 RepID=UPI003F8BEBC0
MSEQFRHRIGEEGVELILKESIRINLAMEDRKKEEMTGIRERRSWTQERPSSGTELLQGSFRRLYKCHARCCRI